jgi:hypothetical protein
MSRRRIYVTVTGLDKPVIAEDGCTTFEMSVEPIPQGAHDGIHIFANEVKLTPAETETVTDMLMTFLNKRRLLERVEISHTAPRRKVL